MSKKDKLGFPKKQQLINIALSKLEEINPKDFQTAISFVKNDRLKQAKKALKDLSNRISSNPVDFVEAISSYLLKYNTDLIQQNETQTYDTIIKETKYFIHDIKFALKVLIKKFDNTYLLIKTNNDFLSLENARLLSGFEELSQILNLTNNHKETEIIYDLKSKIELGFQRYFYYNVDDNKLILKSFDEDGNYEICSEIDKIKLDKYFKTNSNLKCNFKTNNFQEILIQLIYLKKHNKNEYEKELKKIKNLLEFFPESIYTREEYQLKTFVSKSINKNFTENKIDMIKEKKVLINPYNENIINLTLELLQNDKHK